MVRKGGAKLLIYIPGLVGRRGSFDGVVVKATREGRVTERGFGCSQPLWRNVGCWCCGSGSGDGGVPCSLFSTAYSVLCNACSFIEIVDCISRAGYELGPQLVEVSVGMVYRALGSLRWVVRDATLSVPWWVLRAG